MFTREFFSIAKSAPEVLTAPRKFDVALRPTPGNKCLDDLKNNRTDLLSVKCLLEHLSKDTILQCNTNNLLWPIFLNDIILHSHSNQRYNKSSSTDNYLKVMELVDKNLTIQHAHLSMHNVTHENLMNQDLFKTWIQKINTANPLLSNLLYVEEQLGQLVEKIGGFTCKTRFKHVRNNPDKLRRLTKWSCKILKSEVVWNKDVIVFTYNNTSWLLPQNYCLMMHNKTCDMISSLLLIQGASGVCYEPEAYELAVRFVSHLTTLVQRYDENYYDIVKSLEGIVIGEVLRSEEEWSNTELINSIADELRSFKYEYEGSPLEEIIRSATIPFRHELAGLIKIPGHPLIDVELTAQKVQERTKREMEINYDAIQTTRNLAVEAFIRNYIVKNGEWPPVETLKGCPQIFLEAIRLRKDPNSPTLLKRYPKPSIDDYVFIELGQIYELDRLQHYAQYLKDKSITVLRDKAIACYINREIQTIPWKETRLLLVHLFHTNDELDIFEYLRQYVRSDTSMEDILNYLTIKLVPKEKELKVTARPFGCKTYQDRYRGCVQEENVKHYLDEYANDQSMTLDNLGIIKRMYSFRNLKRAYPGWKILYINFDVSGWNSNFRHETVEPIASDVLDKLFGTEKFFSKTQLAYENGFFYLPDQSGTYHWSGQDGGIEGLNQYTWMAVYIPQMRYALREFNLHFHVMAYGDDYKAALLIPPEQADIDIGTLKKRIVKIVANSARINFGQQMKYFDSYGSEVYISFCKNASVKGVEMPQGVRKIQKCYGSSNAFLPTLDEYIASAFSNAHSAAKTMPCTFPSYRVALFWSYHHLIRHHLYKGLSDTKLHGLMLTPSCVGGLPVLYLSSFHTRAENDHLPVYLDLLSFLQNYDHPVFLSASQGLTFEIIDDSNKETLLRDPYSLPVKKPPLPSSILRREILPALKPEIRNEEVSDLIAAAEDEWSNQFIKALTSSEILYPRILSSIYACTPKAMIEEIVRRFESSASVKDILIMRRGVRTTLRILGKVLRAEITLQEWRVKRVINDYAPGTYWKNAFCPTELADKLRGLWGKPIRGVTMPPLTHLLVICSKNTGALDLHSRDNHFSYYILEHKRHLSRGFSCHWDLGDRAPFLGIKTKLGVEMPQIRLIEDNPFLSKIKTLLDIISWVDKGGVNAHGQLIKSNMPELIMTLLSHYYKGDPQELLPFGARRKSGTIKHHWRSPHYREHIMPNTLYNTYTWVKGESNTHLNLRGTNEHYSINFLQIYCHVIHMLQMSLEYASICTTEGEYWCVTTECSYCMKPIFEEPIVLNSEYFPPPRPSPLEGLALTSLSRKLLAQALTDLTGKPIRKAGDLSGLTTEMAVTGVVQKLIDQTHARTTRVCERLDAPRKAMHEQELLDAWIPGGHQELVREREIRCSPIKDLTEAILVHIYHWSFKLGPRSQVRTLLYRVWIANPRDLPWLRIIEMINQAGCLPDLILTCEKLVNLSPPVCYDNPIAASRYIGEVAITAGDNQLLPFRIMWLTYFEDYHVEHLLEQISKRAQYQLIWRQLIPLLRDSLRYGIQDSVDIIMVSTLLVSVMQPISVDEATRILDQNHGHGFVPTLQLVDCSQEEYEDAIDDQQHLIHEVFEVLNRLHFRIHTMTYDNIEPYINDAMNLILLEADKLKRVEVYQGTLADCINYVRELPPTSLILQSQSGSTTSGGEISINRSLSIGNGLYGYRTRGLDMPVLESFIESNPREVYQIPEYIVSHHYLYRVYGHGTTSLNKIIELFAIIGIDHTQFDNLNIMCLGEGYGGILDFFASLGHNCHFVYNTLPPDTRFQVYPMLATDNIRKGNHTVDTRLVNTSIYDLTDSITAHALITNDELHYHLITCDAEAAWESGYSYIQMLRHVCHIYNTKKTHKGVLILKVMIEFDSAVKHIMSHLSHFCDELGLFKLNSSPPGGECYIYARGTRRVYTPSDWNESPRIIPKIERSTETLLNKLKIYYKDRSPPREIQLSLELPKNISILKKLKHKLPPAFVQKITGTYSIPIDLIAVLDDQQDQSRSLYREISKARDAVWNEYHSLGSTDAATVVHLGIKCILTASLSYHGFLILVRHRTELSQQEIRTTFLDVVQELEPRIILPKIPDVFVSHDYQVNGVVCDPFGIWMIGLACILSFWSWLQL
ncbi:RNA-dependent RNA polymerase [Herr Frank virus 1]|uniref:RNA-directed RNA polymerase L n=1 Tax=Herr Frank virus 1 TaxID=2847181 RepID=A0A6C0PII7_9VIRU|nr:RNA-dependent RNA polymerase [Herr Frank virus 1]QHX39760.1 RNA-dependent RNA polymerase [Herr Frank virus 1]QHX39784.1 RNA-dependent RNA polymerase [Herr Frank virus 1]